MDLNINQVEVLEDFPAPATTVSNTVSTHKPFIEANTIDISLEVMAHEHIIPVWTANNEPLISHAEFIDVTEQITTRAFRGEHILKPQVRVSHPVKGRIPEARFKKAAELLPHEQTLYYERMAFIIEIPTITGVINGNILSLTVGGVKSYALDNMYGKRGYGAQHFQIFIGFQNKVCTNMCVYTDGYKLEANIRSLNQLVAALENLIRSFSYEEKVKSMNQLVNVELSETEFAQIIGRARLHRYLPEALKADVNPLLLGDQQMGAVARAYYEDADFSVNKTGNLSLWNFYNLLTGANKTSYIDSFLERSVNSLDFTNEIMNHKVFNKQFWYLG
jgi:hypothetical protein